MYTPVPNCQFSLQVHSTDCQLFLSTETKMLLNMPLLVHMTVHELSKNCVWYIVLCVYLLIGSHVPDTVCNV